MRLFEEDVAPEDWRARCTAVVQAGATMLDMLAAIDRPDADRIEVLAHLVDVPGRERHLLRTGVARSSPDLDTLVDLLAGAGWHEREIHEMFGVRFVGNPDLRPLLTTGDMGWPLRRTTPLPVRMATSWPGVVDPADRGSAPGRSAARPRTPLTPPGVPQEWQT